MAVKSILPRNRYRKGRIMESRVQAKLRPLRAHLPHHTYDGPVLYRCSMLKVQIQVSCILGRGPTPADANPSTRGLIWIRAHTA